MDIALDMDPPMRSRSTWIERTAVFPAFVRVTGHPYIAAFSTNLRTALQSLDIPFGSTIRDKQSAVSGQAPITVFTAVESGNTMEITFSGTQRETETEREFFRFLVRDGIPVRIESNRRGAGREESE